MAFAKVRGRNRETDVPPKAFTDIHDAWVEKETCGKHRYIWQMGDLFCVGRTAVQAVEAYLAAKGIEPRALTHVQIRKLMERAGAAPEPQPMFPPEFADE